MEHNSRKEHIYLNYQLTIFYRTRNSPKVAIRDGDSHYFPRRAPQIRETDSTNAADIRYQQQVKCDAIWLDLTLLPGSRPRSTASPPILLRIILLHQQPITAHRGSLRFPSSIYLNNTMLRKSLMYTYYYVLFKNPKYSRSCQDTLAPISWIIGFHGTKYVYLLYLFLKRI